MSASQSAGPRVAPVSAQQVFADSLRVKQDLIDSGALNRVDEMAVVIAESIRQGGKLMICGNGGSAADAQHLAAELLVRLDSAVDRRGVPALCLSMDSSTMTACSNDYSYEAIFERMVATLGQAGDVLIGLTTSGNSANVLRAFRAARRQGIYTIGFLGGSGGEALDECDSSLLVPSKVTARIQECHITAGHALMGAVEARLINSGYLDWLNPPSD